MPSTPTLLLLFRLSLEACSNGLESLLCLLLLSPTFHFHGLRLASDCPVCGLRSRRALSVVESTESLPFARWRILKARRTCRAASLAGERGGRREEREECWHGDWRADRDTSSFLWNSFVRNEEEQLLSLLFFFLSRSRLSCSVLKEPLGL